MDIKSIAHKKSAHGWLAYLPAIIFSTAAAFIWVIIILYRYLNFGYNEIDLSFYAQGMWNLLHGNLHISLIDLNLFAEHASFISLLILPIYAVFQHPLTLVFMKIFSYIVASIIIFQIAKEDLGVFPASLVMLLYLLFPKNVFSILYEFTFESLAPAFLVFTYYFFRKGKYLKFCLSAIIVMSVRENLPLIIAMFGILGLFSRTKNSFKWGVLPLTIALCIFLFEFRVFIPAMRSLPSYPEHYIQRYASLGHNSKEILETLFFNPIKLWNIIIEPERLSYVFSLFGPLLIPALFSPHILLLASPIITQGFFSSSMPEHSLYYYYSVNAVPFIFLALINTLYLIKRFFKNSGMYFVLLCIASLSIINDFKYRKDYLDIINNNKKDNASTCWKFIKSIPNKEKIVATYRFLPALSQRKFLFSFGKIYEENYQNPNNFKFLPLYSGNMTLPFVLPDYVNYALIDLSDQWLVSDIYYNPAATLPRVQKFFLNKGWGVLQAADDVILMKKDLDNNSKLVDVSNTPFLPEEEQISWSIDNSIALITARIYPIYSLDKDTTIVPITFYWKSLEQTNDKYLMRFIIQGAGKVIYMPWREIGYVVFPTSSWEKSSFIKQNYWLPLSSVSKEEYSISISFWNGSKQLNPYVTDLSLSKVDSIANPILIDKIKLNR
ncbi:MAG: DUF2079 domain-containing protein [Candidatus Omnitrophica bacterium]|nr:DUF2079 domain-containing protein [Candidatus Omnitrophota bacterium]